VTVKVPILAPTVVMWTGASPWSDLVQRALVWEAREPDTYVNVFFGFPWCDVPDAGMAIQVTTNGNPALARKITQDMADWTWRRRADLIRGTTLYRMEEGVALAKQAVAEKRAPVVLADYSDRSGAATWLLRAIIAGALSRTLVATVADAAAVKALEGAKPGDPVDMEVGGRLAESDGAPVRITGEMLGIGTPTTPRAMGGGDHWVMVRFGNGNVLILSPFLVQITEPHELWNFGLKPADFDVIAIKSRAHFRRGFDDSGFAPTILLVEPDEPFLGTARLEALPFQHLRLEDFYPFGDPPAPVVG
jgi:microcystin degradation protein MlrC